LAAPRTLIKNLYDHWDVVEWLVQLSSEYPSFSNHQIQEVIVRCNPSLDREGQVSIVRALQQIDILQTMPRDDARYINPVVLEFARSLIHEHTLGLSDVLKARVQELKDSTQKLSDGMQRHDMDMIHVGSQRMAEMAQQISQQLEHDRHAIMEIAERAKSADTRIPLQRRYREVLDAYDRYVQPMADMMDASLSGIFYPTLENAVRVLDDAVGELAVRGVLYRQQIAVRQVAYRVKELQRIGRDVLVQCSNTLLPLRNEVRQNSNLSAAISRLLGYMRKHKLRRTFREADMPMWYQKQSPCVQLGDKARQIMAEAIDYTPSAVRFPVADTDSALDFSLEIVDEQVYVSICRHLCPYLT